MIKHLLLVASMVSGSYVAYCQEITTGYLLKEMVSFESVASWPAPFYGEYQASSYDRNSRYPGKDGWFSNHDFSQYLRTEKKDGRTEQVMLDAEGPGAIVRFWLTSTDNRDGILRIYFDHQQKASIVIPAYDLMKSNLPLVIPHSSYEPEGKGGSTLYFPLPYSKHCKITWEEHDDKDNPPRYYQINYRSYAQGTKVKTFNIDQLPQLKLVTADIERRLWHPGVDAKGSVLRMKKNIGPGDSLSLKMPEGPMAIKQITMTVTSGADYAQALRSTILKAFFDGNQTIWCPVGDFAGDGVGGKPLQSWYRTVTDEGSIVSRWIMPYRKRAVISLVNRGKTPVTISIYTLLEDWRWTDKTLYFHVSWKRQKDVRITKWDTTGASEWTQISIKGKGIYVGNVLSVYNKMHTWYGEGDQKIWIDGGGFPAEFGTGTEDYYNTSWAPVVLYQTPFANAPRADNKDSYGYNTFTRTRNLDAVPFKNSFRFTLEMLGWKSGNADFAVTTYWYGTPPSTDNSKAMKEEAYMPLSE